MSCNNGSTSTQNGVDLLFIFINRKTHTDRTMYTLLSNVRKHLIIDDNFHDDDPYLLMLIEAAEDAIEQDLGYSLAILVDPNTGMLPPSIRHAILLLVGNLYAHREPVAFAHPVVIPFTISYLLSHYRHYYIPNGEPHEHPNPNTHIK